MNERDRIRHEVCATAMGMARPHVPEDKSQSYICRHCDGTKVNKRTGKRCTYCKRCPYCRVNMIHRDLEDCCDCAKKFGPSTRRGGR